MSKLDAYYQEYCAEYGISDERNSKQVRSYIRECMEGHTENLDNDDHNPIFFKTVMFGAKVAVREGQTNIIAHMAERFMYYELMFELMKDAFETGNTAFFEGVRQNEDEASKTVRTFFDMYASALFLKACHKHDDQFEFAKWLIDWIPKDKIATENVVSRLFKETDHLCFDSRLLLRKLSLDDIVPNLPEPKKDKGYLMYRAICCNDVELYDRLKQEVIIERTNAGAIYPEIRGKFIAALHHSPEIVQDLLETCDTRSWEFDKLVGLACVTGHSHSLKLLLDHGLTTEHGYPKLERWGMVPCESTLKTIKEDEAKHAFIRSDVADVALETFLAPQKDLFAEDVLTSVEKDINILDIAVHRGALNRLLDPKIWNDTKTAFKIIKENTPPYFRLRYQQEFERFESQISIYTLRDRKNAPRSPKLG